MRAVGYFLSQTQPGRHEPNGLLPDEAVRAFCREQGHQLAALFTPGPSEGERSAFDRMAASFRGPTGRPALVLVPDATHFAPDLETLSQRLLELRSLGCEVRCVDPQDPDLLLNALDRLALRGPVMPRDRRVRRSVLSKAARGEVLGRTPYGYAAGVDGVLKPVPEEAQTVKDIFRLYTGDSRPAIATSAHAVSEAVRRQPLGGIGLRQIARKLNESGSRTRQGRPWTPVGLANILRNRVYTGNYSRYGVTISGAHGPLVDRAVFARAQAVVEGRKPRRRARSAEPFTLGGLLYCGACGEGVFGMTRRRSWKRRDGTLQDAAYRYYECRARPLRGTVEAKQHASWRAERLEEAVASALGGTGPAPLRDLTAVHSEGRGHAKLLQAAEREFMQAIRAVASGRARTESLHSALAALREARKNSGAGEDAPQGADAATAGRPQPPHAGAARDAIAHAVERVIVHPGRVELVTRK